MADAASSCPVCRAPVRGRGHVPRCDRCGAFLTMGVPDPAAEAAVARLLADLDIPVDDAEATDPSLFTDVES